MKTLFALLLLLSSTVFGQQKPEITPYKSTPATDFLRIDSTYGVVLFGSRDSISTSISFYWAIKIDSVFQNIEMKTLGSSMGWNEERYANIVFQRRQWESIKTVSITYDRGKQIDLRKKYTFIPESQMQEY